MRLAWSDEPPHGFDWNPVRATVKKLVSYVGSSKKVVDVLQSRTGDNACSTRASGPMKVAWNASVETLSVRPTVDGKGGLWKTKQDAKKAVDKVHLRAEQGRQQDAKVKVTAFSFALADATQTGLNCRFGGKDSWHCVWLIDGGEEPNTGRLYFVAYDQDVTCTAHVEADWIRLRGTNSEEAVDGWALADPNGKLLVEGMLLGNRDSGKLGPLIRFLYVVE